MPIKQIEQRGGRGNDVCIHALTECSTPRQDAQQTPKSDTQTTPSHAEGAPRQDAQ